MKIVKIVVLVLIATFIADSIYGQADSSQKESPKNEVNKLIEDFEKKKDEALRIKADTALSIKTKNEKLKSVHLEAAVTLDKLIQKVNELDPVKNSNELSILRRQVSEFQDFIRLKKSPDERFKAFRDIETFTKSASILGDAGIISNALKDKSIAGRFSIGLDYLQIDEVTKANKDFYAKALMVIFSNPDTLTAAMDSNGVTNKVDFGATILNPVGGASSIQSAYYESKRYLLSGVPVKDSQFGLALNVGFSSRLWKDTVNGSLESANVFSVNFGPFIEVVPPQLKQMELNVHLFYITRTLMGDVTNNEKFRQAVLNSTKQFFNGFELGLAIKFETLSAFVRMPVIINGKGIPGLSSGQFIGGVNFTVPVKTLAF